MIRVPADIAALVSRQPSSKRVAEAQTVLRALEALGVARDSEVVAFFTVARASPLASAVSSEELMDPCSPTPQMEAATSFVREVFGVPARFVCLTSAEGEGFYLYELTTGAVFDVGASQVTELSASRLQPRWPDFFSFIRWYLA